jgi:hypothetical protein
MLRVEPNYFSAKNNIQLMIIWVKIRLNILKYNPRYETETIHIKESEKNSKVQDLMSKMKTKLYIYIYIYIYKMLNKKIQVRTNLMNTTYNIRLK